MNYISELYLLGAAENRFHVKSVTMEPRQGIEEDEEIGCTLLPLRRKKP